jgi:hypothetical protein
VLLHVPDPLQFAAMVRVPFEHDAATHWVVAE